MIRNQPHITRINNRLNRLIIHIRSLHPQERPIPNKNRRVWNITQIRQNIRPLLAFQAFSQNAQQLTQLVIIIRIDRNELPRRTTIPILRRRLRQLRQRRQELERNPSIHTHPRSPRQSLHSTLRRRRHMNLPPLHTRLPVPGTPPFPAFPLMNQPPRRQLNLLKTPIRHTSHLSQIPQPTIERRILRRRLIILNTHRHELPPYLYLAANTINSHSCQQPPCATSKSPSSTRINSSLGCHKNS